ncbi:MAG: hypothetical protein HRT45_06200 [Bdellovibrionales bacterium]|nr:hypothetical protein [Bdellovibrionales bacterium]
MIRSGNDFNKSTRMVYVWQAVQDLGRANPAEVLDWVKRKVGLDEVTEKLKRSIYRDLKT